MPLLKQLLSERYSINTGSTGQWFFLASRWLLLTLLLGHAMAQAQSGNVPIASGSAMQQAQFLDVDDAFTLSLNRSDTATELVWVIAPEYYLYKHKFKVFAVSSATGNRTDLTDSVVFTKGLRKSDDYYGMVEVYYYQAVANLNAALLVDAAADGLEVSYQGCADAGLCYPVQKRTLSLSQ